jgi:hypothetical protein
MTYTVEQIRKEYEEIREKHSRAITDGDWELARQLLADYRIRLHWQVCFIETKLSDATEFCRQAGKSERC